jgi:hypothetical protein
MSVWVVMAEVVHRLLQRVQVAQVALVAMAVLEVPVELSEILE